MHNYIKGSSTEIDDEIVYRALNNIDLGNSKTTIAERKVIVEKLFYKGLSAKQIATILKITPRSVARIKKKLNLKESDRDIHPLGFLSAREYKRK